MIWQTSRHRIDVSKVRVMGVVNVTPDSFSDGGNFAATDAAIAHCEQLLREGADILDIGAESSRPGAAPVPVSVEIDRLQPVLLAALSLGCPVSVDTTKPQVMQHVLGMGADIVNDIGALRAPGALEVVASHPNCGVVLMHMLGNPQTMQQRVQYEGDVVRQVRDFLRAQVKRLAGAGVGSQRIVVDPGIGFGKTVEHNVELLARQRELLEIGLPLLAGWSRKSTLGALTGRPVAERQPASLAAALAAVQNGAQLVRVHDVAATVDALKVWRAAGLGA